MAEEVQDQGAQVTGAKSYTDATHIAYADVTGAEPIAVGNSHREPGREFDPRRITVKYNWRTQLGDEGWKVGNIEISGPWVTELENPRGALGSGLVILGISAAPAWARSFAEAQMPTVALVGAERPGKPWTGWVPAAELGDNWTASAHRDKALGHGDGLPGVASSQP